LTGEKERQTKAEPEQELVLKNFFTIVMVERQNVDLTEGRPDITSTRHKVDPT
jgi:hypothetical protein